MRYRKRDTAAKTARPLMPEWQERHTQSAAAKMELRYLAHHVVELLIFVELTLLLGRGVLVLLVLGHKVVHVGLGLGELHLVHALASVPVKESLTPEHSSELLGHALEHLLDGCGVANEGGSHLQALGWDITHGRFDVIRNQ